MGSEMRNPFLPPAGTRRGLTLRRWTLIGVSAVLLGLAALLVAVWTARAKNADGATPLDPLASPLSAYAWGQPPPAAFPLPPYAKRLARMTIVLDPGHGGRADRPNWKRGPTGLREAEVNLRVATFLREFLEQAGARVIMTRDGDYFLDAADAVDLELRANVANEADADVLLSIHHNAADNPDANYTSVWYHGTPDESRASLDVARALLAGLDDGLRLDGRADCALMSDYQVYPGAGFAVLRNARVPAVLTESSFHSNPREEQRLRDPLYNRREAYGLFLGLARYAAGGIPKASLVEVRPRPAPRAKRGGKRGAASEPAIDEVVLKLDDGFGSSSRLRIRADSISVRINDKPAADVGVDWKAGTLIIPLPRAVRGKPVTLEVDFQNVFGQHVARPRIEIPPAER